VQEATMAGKAIVVTDMALMLAKEQSPVSDPTSKLSTPYDCEREQNLSPDTGMRGVGKDVYNSGAATTGKTIVAAVPIVSQQVHGGTSSGVIS
jgi:hypothetical protein